MDNACVYRLYDSGGLLVSSCQDIDRQNREVQVDSLDKTGNDTKDDGGQTVGPPTSASL